MTTATANYDVSVDSLKKIKQEISEIDVVLDAVQGGSSGKTALRNSFINENKETVDTLAQQILDAVNAFDGTNKIGVFYGVLNEVESALDEEMSEALQEVYDNQKQDAPTLTPEELEEVSTKRKNLNDAFKALKEVLTMFGNEEAEKIEPPKIRRGRRSRGPTIWGKYQYAINGEDLVGDANTLGTVAQRVGVGEDGEKFMVKDIKAAMEAAGVDRKNPPATWTVTLPQNVVLTATALDEYEAEWTEETEEDDE